MSEVAENPPVLIFLLIILTENDLFELSDFSSKLRPNPIHQLIGLDYYIDLKCDNTSLLVGMDHKIDSS